MLQSQWYAQAIASARITWQGFRIFDSDTFISASVPVEEGLQIVPENW